MKKIYILTTGLILLSFSDANARQYPQVDHCAYDASTYVETCYNAEGKLMNGWAIEGEQPESGPKQRKKIRQLRKENRRFERETNGMNMQLASELRSAMQPYTLSQFRDGKKNGLSRDIDPYNFAVKKVMYTRGVKNGRYEVYYPNHNLQAEGNYKNGVLEGTFTFFNSNGHKIGEARYKKGILKKGYCRNQKGDRVAMATDGETVVTEVTPCSDVLNTD